MKLKVSHLSSAHTRYDIRIFLKMCTSLAKNENYKVSLVIADGKGDETKNNVNIVDVGAKTGGRITRMTKTVKKVFEKAVELDSDIYHLHDPELIPIGLKLKKLGKKVIFDAHEDLPKQLLNKPYLNKFNKFMLSKTFELYEKFSCKKFDYIITATSSIKNKFILINSSTMDINNYPLLDELFIPTNWNEKENQVCYVGGINQMRGIKELVSAFDYLDNTILNLVGEFITEELHSEIKNKKSYNKINEFGYLNRKEVAKVISLSKAGIVTFHPYPNHIDSQPNKMFEYMSAGLPIISSNFPLWKEIVEGNNCGLCVDPLNPKEIAKAIKYIITHTEEAKKMGENSKRAVEQKYNWDIEEDKLFNIYKEIEKRI